MAMQAVIMAGGAGTRLRPLTCETPKPLAMLCGAPIMDYSLRLLRRHGFDRADATLWYRPRDVQSCFGNGRHGVSLSYIVEDLPVGTAGSVLMTAPQAKDTVLVLSGDGLTDIDLTAAAAFHRQKGAAATLVLTRVAIPLAYGVVVTAEDGRIMRFIEKPDWSRVISSLVNTGVYLLEPEALALIPPDKPFDFGRDLFPLMLKKGLPLYGYASGAYWCDVGDPAAFLKAQGDLLAGRTGFQVLDPGLRAVDGALISADSYVAASARIGSGAVIRGSCVLEGAEIGEGAQLDGAIVCARARVEKGAVLQSGSVLGAGSVAGAFSVLRGQAHIWPGIRLPDDAVIDAPMQDPEVIIVAAGRAKTQTPTQAGQCAVAFLQSVEGKRAAVMHDGGGAACYHTVLGALAAYGAEEVHMLGRGTLGMLSCVLRSLNADAGLLCRDGELVFLDREGLRPDAAASAAIESAARRQVLPAPRTQRGALRGHAFSGSQYVQALAREYLSPQGCEVALRCADPFLAGLARSALALAGHRVSDRSGITLTLTEEGARLTLPDTAVSDVQQSLLLVRALKKRGIAPYDTAGLDAEETGLLPCDGSDACLCQQRLMQDGVAQALLLAGLFAAETPESALAALPGLVRRQVSIPCMAEQKGRVIESLLADAAPRPQGGLTARRGDARALIRPDPTLPLLHVSVSSYNAETAEELCDFYTGRALRALREKT